MINQLALKIAKSIFSFKGGYYRGVDKKVNVPYNNNEPIWMTMQEQIAQMYSKNGTLFELDIDQNKLNIATTDDILDLDEEGKFGEYEEIVNSIIDNDDELIQFLKEHGYNGMQWEDNGELLICLFDKRLIKDYRILD